MNTATHSRHTRLPRRGLSRADLLVSVAAGSVALAAAVPLLARTGIDSGEARSLSNLRTLAAAHEAYSASFSGKQFGVIPEDFGLANGDCPTYLSTIACPPQLLLGQAPNGGWWGMYLGNSGFCHDNPSFSSCAAIVWYKPITLGNPNAGLGSFRLTNAAAFNSYVDGRFYSDRFYSPNDRAAYEMSSRYRDAGVQFDTVDGVEFALSSYCLSPAAMYHPAVLAASNGGYKNPNSFDEGYASPTVNQCAHPDLKTRLLEHNWNVGAPTTSLFGTTDDALPFNASSLACPNTVFFDGHVTRVANSRAIADDAAVQATGGLGLWSRATPMGAGGYRSWAAEPFGPERTSHSILTIDGLLGRDVLTPQ